MVFSFSDRQERLSGSDRHVYLIKVTADQPLSENSTARGGVGLSMSCSATFEQLFRFGSTFSPSSNFSDFVQLFYFLNNFLAFLRQFVTKKPPIQVLI